MPATAGKRRARPPRAARPLAPPAAARYLRTVDFDQLLVRFFGTDDIAALTPDALAAGVDRLRLQFGLERDPGRRFALWCLLYMLGAAPDLDVAFADDADRDAAREFMDAAEREIGDDE